MRSICAVSWVSAALLAALAGGCATAPQRGLQRFAELRKLEGSWVSLEGTLRGGPSGPIVQADDFSALAIGQGAFEPHDSQQRVIVSGRLTPNRQVFESSTLLPYVLEDVTWTGVVGKNLPRTLYIRPTNPGMIHEGRGQR